MEKFAILKNDEKKIIKFTTAYDVNQVKTFKVFDSKGYKYVVMTEVSFNKQYTILEDYI